MKPEELAELERLLAAATVEIEPRENPCGCLSYEPGSISYECGPCKRRRSQIYARFRALDVLKPALVNAASDLLAAAREAVALRAVVGRVVADAEYVGEECVAVSASLVDALRAALSPASPAEEQR